MTCSKMYDTAGIIKEGNLYTFIMFFCDVFLSKKIIRFHHGSTFFRMKEVINDIKNLNLSQVIVLLHKYAVFLQFMRPNFLLQ